MTSPSAALRRYRCGAVPFLTLALTVALQVSPVHAAASRVPAAKPAVITMTTIYGKTVRIPDKQPTALFFFTVGCGECVGGAISLAKAAGVVGKKAQYLALDVDPSEKNRVIAGFLRSIGSPNLPAAIDKGALLTRTYRISALSTLIVVDGGGKVTYRASDPGSVQIQAALTRVGGR